MLSFTATGIPYNTPDGCAADACATSDLRSSLMGVRQAFSRLTLTMRSAAALALASASLGSITLRRPRTARAWAPGRSRLGRQARARRVRTRGARASLRRGGTAPHPGPDAVRFRPDEVKPWPLAFGPAELAPAFRDGFFLVPKLGQFEDAGA